MKAKFQYQSLKPEDVIESNPPTFCASGKVLDAIAHMNQQDGQGNRRFSYILILEESKLVGILTEPDIVRLTAANVDLATTRIDEVMTTKLITLKKSKFLDINMMMTIMRQNQIRHLPIIDDFDILQGLVSVNTICQALHPSNLLKFRRVDEAMTTKLETAPRTASVLRLSKIMAESKTSCVVIVKTNPVNTFPEFITNDFDNFVSVPIGIVTERDIVQFQILGLDLANTIAETIMSTPLACMKTTDSLMAVRQQMEQLRVRRLVIVGEEGELRGIITQFNMMKVLDPAELFGVIETLQSDLEERTSQLIQEKELAQITLQSIGDAVITTDTRGNIVNFNPMAEQLTGWKASEAKNQPLSSIFQIINEYTRKPISNPVTQVLRENKAFDLANDTLLIARNGTEYSIEDSAAPIHDHQKQVIGAVIVFRDVTKSRQLTNQLSWQANHDALTGLYNRREFEQRLQAAISSAQTEGYCHALCYLDLDRFKIINDTCGHNAGDELLQQVATTMLQEVRNSDVLARVGGDEFGFLLHKCTLSRAKEIANNLRQKIENYRFNWQGKAFSIGLSIGLVAISANTDNLSSLMNTADAACYIAKADGRNCIHVYEDNDVELSKSLGERQWIVTLNQALQKSHFCLYTQKIISIPHDREEESTMVNRYEILIRLDQGGKMTLPGTFLPAAERYNLMPAIDSWVINNFMHHYSSHCQNSSNNTISACKSIYSINLSGASINSKRFRLFIREQFERFPILPSTICFEITETVAIANLEIAGKFIQELRELGCSIALDDFGSGMSSLRYLENLTIDYLKIDGSFVKNIVNNQVARATVEYFNHIAKIMKIKTVAEFVENQAILQQLKDIGVDYAQGYEIAKPTPLVFE